MMIVQMSDLLLHPQPLHDRQAFDRRIQAILDRNWPSIVALGPAAATAPTGWTRDPDARLVLLLEGHQRYTWLADGQACERRLGPGEAVWFAPGTPMRTDWSERCRFLGVVLRPRFLRFLVGVGTGRQPGQSPFAHHTALPLAEPGTLVGRALDRLAEGRGDPASAPELLRVLLRLARDHAARCADLVPGKAAATWRRVQEHLAATCHRETDRTAVARTLELNPTYLSDLCRRFGGGGFTHVVEEIRLDRARLLLHTEPDLPVRDIARRVGFASGGYFARVFRRAAGASPDAWRHGAGLRPRNPTGPQLER